MARHFSIRQRQLGKLSDAIKALKESGEIDASTPRETIAERVLARMKSDDPDGTAGFDIAFILKLLEALAPLLKLLGLLV